MARHRRPLTFVGKLIRLISLITIELANAQAYLIRVEADKRRRKEYR